VLILGESGTGKELVARALHRHSRRADKPFLAINCAAIPDALLESELFGHEKGAFTGADRRRFGKFEQADKGTLLLDEVGDMSPATQSKVLRLLQEQRFERVGGNETVRVDVRVIAATNQNLEELMAGGQLRADLFYRLNGFGIWLPPLRERLDDLPPLVEYFLERFNWELGTCVQTLALESLRLLQSYPWPGNVRELQSVLRSALVRARGDVLTPDCLPESLRRERSPAPSAEAQAGAGPAAPAATPGGETADLTRFVREVPRTGEPDLYKKVSLAVDRVLLEEVLRLVQGNQAQASQLLGISRTTLRAKIAALGLAVEKQLLPKLK
jgi:transcriptional regulator with GAF, ATPase, and Fis domain